MGLLPCVCCGTQILRYPSYSTGVQENGFPPARHSDRVRILSPVLSEEFVLRDGPVHRHRRVLLCGGQGRRIPGPYKDGRQRIPLRF